MPLPQYDIPWPPDNLAYGKYAEHSAWYSGDPQELARAYIGMGTPGAKPQGMVNVVRSWFWGKQAIAPAPRLRIHVPMAADIAATSADLLFSEPPQFATDGGSKAIADRLDEIIEAESFTRLLLEAAEVCSALGGVFIRATWDLEVAPDRPLLTVVHPDAAVPEFRYGRMVAVTFWQVLADDSIDGGQPTSTGHVYRHLERHERGAIYHGLYKGNRERLGEPVPLTELPDTAIFADSLTTGDAIETGIDRLTAVYIPNMLPNRLDRKSRLGRSDYAGAEVLMDALDETFTSWMRDLRLGRGRIIVPAEYLRTMPNSRGQGGWFDLDQEVFAPLEGINPQDPGGSITLNQFAIRTNEHRDTAEALIERIVSTAGYSASTFGLDNGTAKMMRTATEVNAREMRSNVTRNKKRTYWQPAIREILVTALMLDVKYFNGPGVAPVEVQLSEAIADDPASIATAVELLSRAGALSDYMKVKMAHPDMDEDDVQAEVKRLQADKGAAVPDPLTLRPPGATDGGQGGGKPGDSGGQ